MNSVITFTIVLWGYVCFYTVVIQTTWGYRLSEYRKFSTSLFKVMSTILFMSEDQKLNFEDTDATNQFMFSILFLSLIYITRMSILAQMTSFYLEAYRRRALIIENIKANDLYKRDRDIVENENIMSWIRFSWCCNKSHKDVTKVQKK